MSGRRLLAAALAAIPGLAGAIHGEASGVGLLLAASIAGVVALLVARSGVAAPPHGPRRFLDIGAWLSGAGALVISVLLSSPTPSFLASATSGRRAVLAVAGLIAAASVALILRRPAPDAP